MPQYYTYTTNTGNISITGLTTAGAAESTLSIPATIDGFPVTAIANNAFKGESGLTSVFLPDGLLTIGKFAFQNCSGLQSITIPAGVTTIGNKAFNSCTALTNVIANPAVPPTLGTSAFGSDSLLGSIAVPAANLSDYQTAAGWSTYSGIIVSQ